MAGGYYFGITHKSVFAHTARRGPWPPINQFEVRHDLAAVFCLQRLEIHSRLANSLHNIRPSVVNAAKVLTVGPNCMLAVVTI